jgi:hypothetical protein
MARRSLGLLALLALRGLGLLALLAIGLDGTLGRGLGPGRLAGTLDRARAVGRAGTLERAGGERDRWPYGVVERGAIMLGSG